MTAWLELCRESEESMTPSGWTGSLRVVMDFLSHRRYGNLPVWNTVHLSAAKIWRHGNSRCGSLLGVTEMENDTIRCFVFGEKAFINSSNMTKG